MGPGWVIGLVMKTVAVYGPISGSNGGYMGLNLGLFLQTRAYTGADFCASNRTVLRGDFRYRKKGQQVPDPIILHGFLQFFFREASGGGAGEGVVMREGPGIFWQ